MVSLTWDQMYRNLILRAFQDYAYYGNTWSFTNNVLACAETFFQLIRLLVTHIIDSVAREMFILKKLQFIP